MKKFKAFLIVMLCLTIFIGSIFLEIAEVGAIIVAVIVAICLVKLFKDEYEKW